MLTLSSSVSRGCKVTGDSVAGNVTIADLATGTQIEASVEPTKRQDKLRQAMFAWLWSPLRTRQAEQWKGINSASQSLHFALNQSAAAAVETQRASRIIGISDPVRRAVRIGNYFTYQS
jgi:hypothetical protein